jgi:hypothetical protein
MLRGFRDREVVPLPRPFGARSVFNFDSPDYDLLPNLAHVHSITVKVGFELRLANTLFAALARLPIRYGDRTATLLNVPGRMFRSVGCSGGAVMVELFAANALAHRAAIVASKDGQRMVALPCVYALMALLSQSVPNGSFAVHELLGVQLLSKLQADGFSLHIW